MLCWVLWIVNWYSDYPLRMTNLLIERLEKKISEHRKPTATLYPGKNVRFAWRQCASEALRTSSKSAKGANWLDLKASCRFAF